MWYGFVITASASAIAGELVYTLTYIPFLFVYQPSHYVDLTANTKLAMSLLPNLAMSIGCKTIVQFELVGMLT